MESTPNLLQKSDLKMHCMHASTLSMHTEMLYLHMKVDTIKKISLLHIDV